MRSCGRFAGLVVVLVGLSALTACTPKPDPMLALHRNTDGRVEALVFVCDGDHVSSLAVYDSDSGSGWRVDRPADYSPRTSSGVVEFQLFQTPPGWSQLERDLSALEPGRRYGASALSVNGLDSSLWFSTANLDLPADRLLVGQDGDLSTVTRQEFERRARQQCP